MAKRLPVRKWKLSELKDNPEQAALFGDVPEEELDQLANHMAEHGLEKPIEITSDGVIIAGHQRVKAAMRLGWTEIDVIVRTDLEGAGSTAVQEHFVNDNLIRRHLTPLARARCIKRLLELECASGKNRRNSNQKEVLKVRIGQRMGLSERSVNRYLLVMETPPTVQRAFDEGQVPLIQAGKVALLPRRKQEEIDRRIQAGEPAVLVIAGSLAGDGQSEGGTARAFLRLVSALMREAPQLKGRLKEIDSNRLKGRLEILRTGAELLSEIINLGEQQAS